MIELNYVTQFSLDNENFYLEWLQKLAISESKTVGEVSVVFCDDEYLLKINIQHLSHDFYTDIITFDYCVGDELNGDVFISIDRVRENASEFKVSFENELLRVMSHGFLHLCGYKDKSNSDSKIMRDKEEEKILLFFSI